jgi:hypothetical protein
MVGDRKHHKRSKKLGKVSNRVRFTAINALKLESQFYRDKNVKFVGGLTFVLKGLM